MILKSAILISFLLPTTVAFAQQRDSLDIKIGQMILIGVPGTTVDEQVLNEIKQGKAGAIIFFEKNIPKSNSYEELKKIAWTYQHAAPIPLFVAIDQEGGRVNRLKEKYGFPRSVSAANIGKSRSLDSARFYGETTAATLAGLGINVNFAPVVDLASNPNNPIIARVERAFSANPDTVALLAREFIIPHQRMGVVTVLKHFPGHGSSKDDTHLGIADVTHTWTDEELGPYEQLIQGGYAPAIMTAHIVNKKLDKRAYPGTLSSSVIDSLLRKKMGFDGVIFSDDMQMHAIAKHYGLEQAIVMAVNAGVDILCFSNNIQGSEERTVDKVHQIIKANVAKGVIPRHRIEESFRRIVVLKSQLLSGGGISQTFSADEQKRLQVLQKQNEWLRLENDSLKKQLESQPKGKKKSKRN